MERIFRTLINSYALKVNLSVVLFITFIFISPFFFCIQKTEAASDKKQIVFAYPEWEPLFYFDQDNKMQGLFSEILFELFENKLGMELVNQDLPWKRCQHNIKIGEADFTIMLPNEDRLKYAEKSMLPVYQFYLNVFTYKNHPKLEKIKTISSAYDIKNLELLPATNIGNGWHDKNIDAYGIKTTYLPKDIQLFRFLSKKRADIVIDFLVPSLYYIRNQSLESEIEVTDARFGPLDMHLMMSKKSKYINMMSTINKAFEELNNNGIIKKIISKYEQAD